MAIVFTPDPAVPGTIQSAGSLLALAGTLTFSGSYVVDGESLDLGAQFKKIGLGKVFAVVSPIRGNSAEYDATAKKLKVYTAANTEHTAVAYNAALTASPVPVVVLGR